MYSTLDKNIAINRLQTIDSVVNYQNCIIKKIGTSAYFIGNAFTNTYTEYNGNDISRVFDIADKLS